MSYTVIGDFSLPDNPHSTDQSPHRGTHRTGHENHSMKKSLDNYMIHRYQSYHNAESIAIYKRSLFTEYKAYNTDNHTRGVLATSIRGKDY